jgi:hypothetical protein
MDERYAGVIKVIDLAKKQRDLAERRLSNSYIKFLESIHDGDITDDPKVFAYLLRREDRVSEFRGLAKQVEKNIGKEVLFARAETHSHRERVYVTNQLECGDGKVGRSVAYRGPPSSPIIGVRNPLFDSVTVDLSYGLISNKALFELSNRVLDAGILIHMNKHLTIPGASLNLLDTLIDIDHIRSVNENLRIKAIMLPPSLFPCDGSISGFYFGKDVAGFFERARGTKTYGRMKEMVRNK